MNALIPLLLMLAAAPAHQHHDHTQHAALAAAPVAADESVYHLDQAFTDHRGRPFRLADLRGGPAIVVMFYGDCNTACPILLHDAGRLDQLSPDAVRARTQVVLVSFDSGNDTPEVLAEYARLRRLDDARWRFVHGDRAQVRALAMMLGVRYRESPGGGFNHTNLVTVLDGEGRIIARVEGLMQPMEDAAAALAGAAR